MRRIVVTVERIRWATAILLAMGCLQSVAPRVAAAGEREQPPDPLAEILDALGIPFVPPGFRERFHVGRVEPPRVQSDAPPAPGFMPAEWEPAIGVFVVWPRNLPDDLLTALAANVPLYVITEEGPRR